MTKKKRFTVTKKCGKKETHHADDEVCLTSLQRLLFHRRVPETTRSSCLSIDCHLTDAQTKASHDFRSVLPELTQQNWATMQKTLHATTMRHLSWKTKTRLRWLHDRDDKAKVKTLKNWSSCKTSNGLKQTGNPKESLALCSRLFSNHSSSCSIIWDAKISSIRGQNSPSRLSSGAPREYWNEAHRRCWTWESLLCIQTGRYKSLSFWGFI